VVRRSDEHGGFGPIEFRRVFDRDDFHSPIDFVDVTVVLPGTAIGLHGHESNEEIYIVMEGSPLVRVEHEERRLYPWDVSVVRSGQRHGLINDTPKSVVIAVVQVRMAV
jgi:mannose-6-phosphate isomerase-like protein (cupin superfamily)